MRLISRSRFGQGRVRSNGAIVAQALSCKAIVTPSDRQCGAYMCLSGHTEDNVKGVGCRAGPAFSAHQPSQISRTEDAGKDRKCKLTGRKMLGI